MYHIKINKFSSQKRPLREWKCQRQSRERYLQLPVLHKRLVSGRCKQLPQINKTETNNLRERLVKEKRKKKKNRSRVLLKLSWKLWLLSVKKKCTQHINLLHNIFGGFKDLLNPFPFYELLRLANSKGLNWWRRNDRGRNGASDDLAINTHEVALTGREEVVMSHSTSSYWVPPMGSIMLGPGNTTGNCADKVRSLWRMLFRRRDR